ncbi:hypothetical protein Tco_0378363 [Tanacetum coccineum]
MAGRKMSNHESLLVKLSKNHTWQLRKAQRMGIFTLDSHSEKAQGVIITDCHAGNPCVHICDPTSQSKYPMIGMNKGGDSKEHVRVLRP